MSLQPLHRSSHVPDWESAEINAPTSVQRLAARTQGYVTPGNIVSLIGLIGVLIGIGLVLANRTTPGLVLIAAGRMCDLLDGWIAEKTHTKGPVGAFIDATFDKLGTGLTVLALMIAGILPWWVGVILMIPHFIIAGLSLYAVSLHDGFVAQPSRFGKFGMALAWAAILGFIVMDILSVGTREPVAFLVYLVMVLAILLGFVTAIGYFQQMLAYFKAKRLAS